LARLPLRKARCGRAERHSLTGETALRVTALEDAEVVLVDAA
jgi:hypothetical protein